MFASPVESEENYLGFSPETVDILTEIYGNECRSVIKALKTPGHNFSVRVNLLRTSRAEVSRVFEDEGWTPSPHPMLEEVILLPVLGPEELPEEQGREVMVDKNTAEAILRGADVYAPGITRCHKMKQGEKVYVLAPNHECIASGTAYMSQNEVLAIRRGLAVRVEHTRYRLPSLRLHSLYQKGLIYPQTLPSLLASRNLQSNPGETIVDMNAAPGGKVSHLAELNGNRGRILAFDRHEVKVQQLQENLKRMRISCVEAKVADSRYLDKDFPTIRADAVLVDPPCSALGLRPKIYATTSRREVVTVADYQRQFLETAARILKPHGRILYSVCTMTFEECERQVGAVCERYGLTVEKQQFIIGSPGESSFVHTAECQRFHPHIHDGPGFFMALLRLGGS